MALIPEHVRYLNEKIIISRHGHSVATRCGAIAVVALALLQLQPFGMLGGAAIGAAAFLLMVWPEMKSVKVAEAEYVEYTTGPDATEEEGLTET